MFTSYRRILAQPGALRFSMTGLVARLPISMVGLGIVLLVSAATGSYGVAGAISAAYMVANAGVRDPPGPAARPARPGAGCCAVASIGFGVALALLVVSVQADWPIGWTYVARRRRRARSCPRSARACGPAGPTCSSSRPTCRPRSRSRRCSTRPSSSSARSWSTVLATAWHPVAGLAVAVVACVGGTLAFTAQRATEPPPHPRDRSRGAAAADAVALGRPARHRLRLPRACSSAPPRSTTVAFAEEQRPQGARRRAARAVGARQPVGRRHHGRDRTGGAARRAGSAGARFAMACAMVPLSFIDSLPLMGAGPLRRRLRDRADDDRHDVADRGRRAAAAG